MILPKSASVGCVPPAHIPHGEYLMSQNGTSDILHSADRLSRCPCGAIINRVIMTRLIIPVTSSLKCCIASICNVCSGN